MINWKQLELEIDLLPYVRTRSASKIVDLFKRHLAKGEESKVEDKVVIPGVNIYIDDGIRDDEIAMNLNTLKFLEAS